MKKIMFVFLAAMAMSFTATATSVDWQFTTKGTSTAASGGTVYLVLGTASSYATIADLETAAVDSASITGSSKLTSGAQTWDGGTKAVGTTDTFSMVIVDSGKTGYYIAGTGYVGTYYDPTDTLTAKPSAMAKTVTAAITSASLTSFSGAGGTPEPTSGLLLLVGGAMLALRRKQK